jgi:hypothetical protein
MESCINIYDQFLDSVKKITLVDIQSYKNNIEGRINSFYKSLENDDIFSLFCLSKIKVFSAKTVETHTVSTSLFGEELTLKQIFNNQPDNVKTELWELLFNLYIQFDKINNPESSRINLLKDNLKKNRHQTSNIKSDILKNVLKTDVNATTNNMLDDIINSFQSVVNNKGNPFENIMGIAETITSKYGSQVESGEVEIDKLLNGMSGMLGSGLSGLNKPAEEPVVIDENFSTSNVEVGKEEDEKQQFNLSKLMPLADMVTKINSVHTQEDILSLKKDMDNFMEKELKVDMSQYKENIEKLEKEMEKMKLNNSNVEEHK